MAHSHKYPQVQVAAENALMVYLAAEPGPVVLQQIQQLCQLLRQALPRGILELVPSYHSLLVVFDLLQLAPEQVEALLWQSLPLLSQDALAEGKIIELPCYYAEESGPDLARVAALHQLTQLQLIKKHSDAIYQVYAIGFAPGFAYLGWVDPSIATARLATPRSKVLRGSVALADRQTAVYPATSPGGWNLLGNCPISLFDLQRDPMLPFAIADQVRFIPIERAEFIKLGGEL